MLPLNQKLNLIAKTLFYFFIHLAVQSSVLRDRWTQGAASRGCCRLGCQAPSPSSIGQWSSQRVIACPHKANKIYTALNTKKKNPTNFLRHPNTNGSLSFVEHIYLDKFVPSVNYGVGKKQVSIHMKSKAKKMYSYIRVPNYFFQCICL